METWMILDQDSGSAAWNAAMCLSNISVCSSVSSIPWLECEAMSMEGVGVNDKHTHLASPVLSPSSLSAAIPS